MTKKNYFKHDCPIARSLGILGGQWTLLIARDLLNGVNKFDQIQRNLRISRNLLTQRLREMEKIGLAEKIVPKGFKRAIYQPTRKCIDLANILIALIEWSEKWDPDTTGPRIQIKSAKSGEPLKLALLSATKVHKKNEKTLEINYKSNPKVTWAL